MADTALHLNTHIVNFIFCLLVLAGIATTLEVFVTL
jgi:hypothetical protein